MVIPVYSTSVRPQPYPRGVDRLLERLLRLRQQQVAPEVELPQRGVPSAFAGRRSERADGEGAVVVELDVPQLERRERRVAGEAGGEEARGGGGQLDVPQRELAQPGARAAVAVGMERARNRSSSALSSAGDEVQVYSTMARSRRGGVATPLARCHCAPHISS